MVFQKLLLFYVVIGFFSAYSQINQFIYGEYPSNLRTIAENNINFRYNTASNIFNLFNFYGSQSSFLSQYGDNSSKIDFSAQKFQIRSSRSTETQAIHFNEVNNSNTNLISGKFNINYDTANTDASSSLFIALSPLNQYNEVGLLNNDAFLSPLSMVKGFIFEFKINIINIYWNNRIIKKINHVFRNDRNYKINYQISYGENNAQISLYIAEKMLGVVTVPKVMPYRNKASLISKGKSRFQLDNFNINYIEFTNIKNIITLSKYSSSNNTVNNLELNPYSSNIFDTTIINLDFSQLKNSELSISLLSQEKTKAEYGLSFTFNSNNELIVYWNKQILESILIPPRAITPERKIIKILLTQVPEGHALSFYDNKNDLIKETFIKGFFPYYYKPYITGSAVKSLAVDNGKNAIVLNKVEFYNINQTIDKLFVLDKKHFKEFDRKDLRVFQGLINRKIPKIFYTESTTDIFWLDVLKRYYGINAVQTVSIPHLFQSVAENVKEIGKFIVYPIYGDIPVINSAATYAGQINAFIFNQETYAQYSGYLEDTLHLRKVADWASENKFLNNTTEDIQQWMYLNLLKNSNPLTFFMAPTVGSYFGHDYAVANNLFWMILDASGLNLKDYSTTQTAILKSFRPTGALGIWSQEVPDIRALSTFGHTRIGLSKNTTVYAFLPRPKSINQKINLNSTVSNTPIDRTAKYIYLSFTQGDGLEFCLSLNLETLTYPSCYNPGKTFGEIYNYGMMCSTFLYYFNPAQLHYFYNSQNRILFTAKGYGYNNPSTLISNGYQDIFVRRSKKLMSSAGILDFMLNDNTNKDSSSAELAANKKTAETIANLIKPRSIFFKHAFDRYAPEGTANTVNLYNVPVFMDPIMVKPNDSLIAQTTGQPPCERMNSFDFTSEVNQIINSSKIRQFQWVFLDFSVSANAELFEKFYFQLTEYIKNNKLNIKVVTGDEFLKAYFTINSSTAGRR